MTLDEIKAAIAAGKKVFWSNKGYTVTKDKNDHYHISYIHNSYCIGLTHVDGVTMNGKECDFFIGQETFRVPVTFAARVDLSIEADSEEAAKQRVRELMGNNNLDDLPVLSALILDFDLSNQD